MPHLFRDKEHLVRVVLLFAAGVAAFLVLQGLLTPKEFGVYGHFRTGALDDNAARPVAFAGHARCAECHGETAVAKAGGRHAGVACEACHGALARHAEDPGALAPDRPAGRPVCLHCHTANVAKPKWFPAIDPKEHGEEGPCTACHPAHDPGVPSGEAP